jgi:hypothetical protein
VRKISFSRAPTCAASLSADAGRERTLIQRKSDQRLP